MQPRPPSVQLPVWKELYAAAERFRSAQPWEMLDDTDLIGVRNPTTGDTGYGVVMGNAGTLFGLCLYRGVEGFTMYRRLMEGGVDPELDDVYALQNCLKVELGLRSDLEPEDLTIIRRLGLKFRGKNVWPQFRSLLPAYAPWFLTEAEAQFLTLGLDVTCHHLRRIGMGEVNVSIREKQCLVYSAVRDAEGNYQAGWEPWPDGVGQSTALPILNLSRINALLAKKTRPDSAWEAGIVHIPASIRDRERPYYLRIVVVCQRTSGFVFATEACPPEAQGNQVLADTICSSIERHGFLPETIFVRSVEECDALKALAKALGFTIRHKKNLTAIRMLKNDMMERFV